jgi:hypothetical protein
MKLTNLAVYALPDGKEFVAGVARTGYFELFPAATWHLFRFARYLVDQSGRLLSDGKPTSWRIENLRDTGRRENYPRPTAIL